jgi:hypothetical protein
VLNWRRHSAAFAKRVTLAASRLVLPNNPQPELGLKFAVHWAKNLLIGIRTWAWNGTGWQYAAAVVEGYTGLVINAVADAHL